MSTEGDIRVMVIIIIMSVMTKFCFIYLT